MGKEKLKFYDLRERKSFFTDNYDLIKKKVKGRDTLWAKTVAPSGVKSMRIVKAKM